MKNQFDVELEKFGKLTYLETLCFYDRDLAMSYKDESESLYYVYLQPNQGSIERWILLPVSPEDLGRIERLELRMKDWAELLTRAETKVYSFDNPNPDQVCSILEWSKERINEYSESLLS